MDLGLSDIWVAAKYLSFSKFYCFAIYCHSNIDDISYRVFLLRFFSLEPRHTRNSHTYIRNTCIGYRVAKMCGVIARFVSPC